MADDFIGKHRDYLIEQYGSKKEISWDNLMTEDERRHRKILDEMADTFSKKNSDYGNAFEEILDDFGASYAIGRLKEKHKRLTQLVISSKQKVEDESVEDTLLDMANYAVLTIMWLQKQKEKQANGK